MGVVVTTPKTERSRRTVKLPAHAVTPLRQYIKGLNRNQGLVFTTASGKPMNPRHLIKKFKEAIEVAGLPESGSMIYGTHIALCFCRQV